MKHWAFASQSSHHRSPIFGFQPVPVVQCSDSDPVLRPDARSPKVTAELGKLPENCQKLGKHWTSWPLGNLSWFVDGIRVNSTTLISRKNLMRKPIFFRACVKETFESGDILGMEKGSGLTWDEANLRYKKRWLEQAKVDLASALGGLLVVQLVWSQKSSHYIAQIVVRNACPMVLLYHLNSCPRSQKA